MNPAEIYCDHPATLNGFLATVSGICHGLPGDWVGVVASWQDCAEEENWIAQAWVGYNCGSPDYWRDYWDPKTDCDDCGGYGPPFPDGK